MPHPRFVNGEISQRGEELYEQSIRSLVETEENIGRFISIDIETGDYEIDTDVLAPALRLQAKHPDAAIYGKRIGYNAVFAAGGSRTRVTI